MMRVAGAFVHVAAGRHTERAFSLLEVVIALAIVAVVAAYAVPNHVRHVARGHRMAVVTALYRAAQFLEAEAGEGHPGLNHERLPAGLDQVPSHGVPVYRLRVSSGAPGNGGYTLEALPVESGPMRDDACGTFVLNATGKRFNRSASGYVPPEAHCWAGRA
ncbi:MAG TPA: type IV pilin protein [Trinickia sp.]|jgi:type IV pilus assembly protein PilE|uniref:type IV pilin protein n=1 Tax=Trinickia sp. TaxID=2571163 RepID=UPI002CDE5106|nr:type IV pilin protein [Trinickia sp.]HTI18835.1 type IV pilin protein [Trinickia sp.]